MPRLRNKVHPMTRLLLSYQANGNNLSAILRCSPATARKKIAEPKYLTVGDLIAINRKWAIPLDEIRRCVC